MTNKGIVAKASLPYAEALFELSQAVQLIEKTLEDLNLITTTLEQSSILKSFLVNPLVISKAKKSVLSDLFLDQISTHVFNFLLLLIDRRRITLLNSVAACYLDLVNQIQLVTLVDVYSVVGLTELQKDHLKEKLQFITNSKQVKLISHIDTELIGGFVVKIGSKIIDMSIYGQLSQISAYLNGTRF